MLVSSNMPVLLKPCDEVHGQLLKTASRHALCTLILQCCNAFRLVRWTVEFKEPKRSPDSSAKVETTQGIAKPIGTD